MTTGSLINAEDFTASRGDLPANGRWHELIAGKIECFEAPHDDYGTIVLNVGKAIGAWLQNRGRQSVGCAAFDTELIVCRNPDSVLCPAITFFAGGSPFEVVDQPATDRRPNFVLEVASTDERRRMLRERVEVYHAWGVDLIWVVDPVDRLIEVCPRNGRKRTRRRPDFLTTDDTPGDFELSVRDVFEEPNRLRTLVQPEQ